MSDQPKQVGCIGCIVFIIAMWALLFGVTVGGVHYGMSCTCVDGVKVGRK